MSAGGWAWEGRGAGCRRRARVCCIGCSTDAVGTAAPRARRENTQRELQQHAQARQAALSHEQQREDAWLAQPQQVYVDTQRPWTAQSTTYHISRQDEVCTLSLLSFLPVLV